MNRDAIYDIINTLQQMQADKELDIAARRDTLAQAFQFRKQELTKLHLQRLALAGTATTDKTVQRHFREKQALEDEMIKEMAKFDLQALNELDEKVFEQQVALQKAGVPGFFPTKDPQQLDLQSKILAAILENGPSKLVFFQMKY